MHELISVSLVLTLKNDCRLWKRGLKEEDLLKGIAEDIIRNQKKFYLEILSRVPLGSAERKIAVYWTGNHTEGLLKLYERFVGEIKCKPVFVDSNKDNDVYQERSLINYQRIDNSFDSIIISSFIYEKEMICNIRKVNKKIPIIRFYGEITTDIFSNYKDILKFI